MWLATFQRDYIDHLVINRLNCESRVHWTTSLNLTAYDLSYLLLVLSDSKIDMMARVPAWWSPGSIWQTSLSTTVNALKPRSPMINEFVSICNDRVKPPFCDSCLIETIYESLKIFVSEKIWGGSPKWDRRYKVTCSASLLTCWVEESIKSYRVMSYIRNIAIVLSRGVKPPW